MKGQIAVDQRKRLARRLREHDRVGLHRLAHAVEARAEHFNAFKYSRMHHRHNKSLANSSKFVSTTQD